MGKKAILKIDILAYFHSKVGGDNQLVRFIKLLGMEMSSILKRMEFEGKKGNHIVQTCETSTNGKFIMYVCAHVHMKQWQFHDNARNIIIIRSPRDLVRHCKEVRLAKARAFGTNQPMNVGCHESFFKNNFFLTIRHISILGRRIIQSQPLAAYANKFYPTQTSCAPRRYPAACQSVWIPNTLSKKSAIRSAIAHTLKLKSNYLLNSNFRVQEQIVYRFSTNACFLTDDILENRREV